MTPPWRRAATPTVTTTPDVPSALDGPSAEVLTDPPVGGWRETACPSDAADQPMTPPPYGYPPWPPYDLPGVAAVLNGIWGLDPP
ncbi:hypothetical protein [Streptosporangium sp. NPDC004631]